MIIAAKVLIHRKAFEDDFFTCASQAFVWYIFLSFMACWTTDTKLWVRKLLKPQTEESHIGLTSALNCKEEKCDMFRIAGFEGVWNHFYLPKTLSHSEVSHSTECCTGTQPPAVLWPPHSDIKPSLNLRISFQRKTSILHCSWSRGMVPVMIFSSAFKARLSRAQSQCLNRNTSVSVNNIGEHSGFFFFLSPIRQWLTDRKAGWCQGPGGRYLHCSNIRHTADSLALFSHLCS